MFLRTTHCPLGNQSKTPGRGIRKISQWEPTLESTREPEEKLFRKEKELRLADRITCPSQFVLDSIPSEIRDQIPCQIAHFGSPTHNLNISFRKKRENGPFKVFLLDQ